VAQGTMTAAIERDVPDSVARSSLLKVLQQCVDSELAPCVPPPPYGSAAAVAEAASSLEALRGEHASLRVTAAETRRRLAAADAQVAA
jgi:hypothetical protein